MKNYLIKTKIIPVIIIIFGSVFLQQSCRKISEPEPAVKKSIFDDCIYTGSDAKFEIVTINLEGFAKAGSTTISIVQELIEKIDPDIIAMQEMDSETDFNDLLNKLDGWEGRFYPQNNAPWNLAYIFKTSEISIDDSKTGLILSGDSYAFPRPPFEVFVTHKGLNISAYLIDLHLKCCGGADNMARRRDASEKLENYIKDFRSDDPVILLGDYNDIISGNDSATNVFYNFVSLPSEYRFTDMDIAKGNAMYWSYPLYPSDIDHILVTNELFDRIDTTMVLRPDICYTDYFDNISDHRPVELVLK